MKHFFLGILFIITIYYSDSKAYGTDVEHGQLLIFDCRKQIVPRVCII